MSDWINHLKPGTSARIHLLLVGSMWTIVGAVLFLAGASWVVRDRMTAMLAVFALLTGVLKARFILDRTAHQIVERIKTRGDGRCLGGFLSVQSWAFVALMAGLGRWLRSGILARNMVGLLYVAVGAALFISSRSMWRAWREI